MLHARRQYRAAIAEYDRTLEIDPHFYCAYVLRAGARRHLLDTAGAYRDFRRGMDLNPPLAARLIIQSLVETLTAGAADTLRECALHLRRNPADFLTVLCRGLAFLLLGAAADAEADFEKFRELKPDEKHNQSLLIREAERRRLLSPLQAG